MDGWYLLYALSLIGTVVYAFRSVLCGKIAVCNIRPRLPPYLGFLLAVPVNCINLAALKCAVFQFDTLTESRVYEIAAVVKSNDVEELPFEFTTARDDGAEDVIENMESASLYDTGVDMAYGDDFLTLATCDYSVDDGRLVVMAKRIQ